MKAINKAERIVNSATKIFEKAIEKVSKANSILNDAIEKELIRTTNEAIKIKEAEDKIKNYKKAVEQKKDQIVKNAALIERLSQFK